MSTDSQLKTDILAELAWEPSISADHIGVTAKNGVVTLTGHVETFSQKKAAETAAGRVKGLKALAEEIEVRLPFDIKHHDDEIAAAAIARLNWDVSVPLGAVTVKVEKGQVTLTGTVGRLFEKSAAEWDMRALSGVKGVTNNIVIKPSVDSALIGDDIRHALHRSWLSDGNIKVSAADGRVHLTGHVDTWRDREVAEAIAWAAPGATWVNNDIKIP
jgi:osmotically-inducible protein OsmY